MNSLKYAVLLLLLGITYGCSPETQSKDADPQKKVAQYELGEYLYLESEEGLICHIDPNCGKHCTYIKAEQVFLMVKECKAKGDYYRSGKAASLYDALNGNYHFCSKCIPLSIMKEIDAKTDPCN